jgi:hypothetical protein
MSVTLISTPVYEETSVSPAIAKRWVATESPINFRLLRKDFVGSSEADSGGYLQITLAAPYTGQVGNDIVAHSAHNDAVYIGKVTDIASPATTITTDITWDAALDIDYVNDNTLKAGYYFEGQLGVNFATEPITVIASPDSKGYADLDVSGVLRIKVALGKTGDYTQTLAAEPTKGGVFQFAYREQYIGADPDAAYQIEGHAWYYVEAVRSVEQGSNLHEWVSSEAGDAPFFNAFDEPVYFAGLPFDLTFLLPYYAPVSPMPQLQVIIKRYNSVNTLLGTTTEVLALDAIDGSPVSLRIDPAIIEATAAYLTAEINLV